VWVTYFDLACKEWVTSAKYLASEEGSRYANLWVAAVPDGQTPRDWLGSSNYLSSLSRFGPSTYGASMSSFEWG
jgi:hypothetical protein